jgi:hypothetical protein
MTCSVEGTKEMCTLYPNRWNKFRSTEYRHWRYVCISTIGSKNRKILAFLDIPFYQYGRTPAACRTNHCVKGLI